MSYERVSGPGDSYAGALFAGAVILTASVALLLSGQPKYPGLEKGGTTYKDGTRVETFYIDEGKTLFQTVVTSCTDQANELKQVTLYTRPEFAQGDPNPTVERLPTKYWCDDNKITDTDW